MTFHLGAKASCTLHCCSGVAPHAAEIERCEELALIGQRRIIRVVRIKGVAQVSRVRPAVFDFSRQQSVEKRARELDEDYSLDTQHPALKRVRFLSPDAYGPVAMTGASEQPVAEELLLVGSSTMRQVIALSAEVRDRSGDLD